MRLRREARWLWPILAIVLTGLACAGYVLNKQRLESPLADRYELLLEFDNADAVTPGTGSPITVAGVKVGQIDGARLEGGRGVVSVSIDPTELPHVYTDATAQLVPNTPLKDMQIRLTPAGARPGALPDGGRIDVADTITPVDADGFRRALDSDTRAWVRSLIAGLDVGHARAASATSTGRCAASGRRRRSCAGYPACWPAVARRSPPWCTTCG